MFYDFKAVFYYTAFFISTHPYPLAKRFSNSSFFGSGKSKLV